jgi:hypothetical protein
MLLLSAMVSVSQYIKTSLASVEHNIGRFQISIGDVYSNFALSVWLLESVETVFSNQEPADVILIYCFADGKAMADCHLYQEIYPE